MTAAGDDIIIMPGGRVNATNIIKFFEKTQASEYHSSAKSFEKSKMKYFHNNINMGGSKNLDEFSRITVDAQKVKAIIEKTD